jgi:hypothetical protein
VAVVWVGKVAVKEFTDDKSWKESFDLDGSDAAALSKALHVFSLLLFIPFPRPLFVSILKKKSRMTNKA